MHTRFQRTYTRLMAALLAVAAVGWLSAGSLTPPAGPIAPTMKPLDEIEPRIAVNATNTPGDADSIYKITQPGSYYLTGNITGVVGKMGIEIAAFRVTLDLMGFELAGVAGSLDGIFAGSTKDIVIRNGSVTGWGQDGIEVPPPFTGTDYGSIVEGVRASSNAGRGILVPGNSVIRECIVRSNGGVGIGGANGSTISACTASLNAGGGIARGSGCRIVGCATYNNPMFGISVGHGCTITDCTAFDNTGKGISAFSSATVTACTAIDNSGKGFEIGNGSTITGCTAATNGDDGISVGANTTVSGCTALDNTGSGIVSTATGIHVTGCTAGSNDGHGISISDGKVTDCESSNNHLNGIHVGNNSLVTGNKASGNGVGANVGAGIYVEFQDNRIESNTVADNDRGIEVDAGGNLIIRNSATGNSTNYDIANGNAGFYVSVSVTGAVSGSSGGTTIGTTDPWANLSF